MVVDELYDAEPQQLPDLDDLDYMGDTATPFSAKAESTFSFDGKVLQNALDRIYKRDFAAESEIEEGLWQETLRIITDATNTGIDTAEISVDFRRKIDLNNAIFSAFKVHRMQNDLADKLFDSDGNLRSFNDWKSAVQPLLNHQVKHWLQTEYDTAVTRARQAADWQRFEEYKDVLPNLEWLPSTSANPGEDHKIFWGTILPIDSTFWDYHRPGDRWNCKCGLAATDDPPTGEPNYSKPDIVNDPQPGLDNNPGKDGKLFSDTHPYFTNAYPGADVAVSMLIDTQYPEQ